jgi:hypothetical protein
MIDPSPTTMSAPHAPVIQQPKRSPLHDNDQQGTDRMSASAADQISTARKFGD